MKRIAVLVVLAIVLAAFTTACATRRGAERASRSALRSGGTVYVLIDRGIEKSFTDMQVANRNQVGDWMERDLPMVLKKRGIRARIISRRSEFTPAGGAYLLTVKITNYNPGSRAARMFVGFGAGAASMDTHFELYGQGDRPLATGDPSVGSGRDWRNVIRKIDEITTRDVLKALGD